MKNKRHIIEVVIWDPCDLDHKENYRIQVETERRKKAVLHLIHMLNRLASTTKVTRADREFYRNLRDSVISFLSIYLFEGGRNPNTTTTTIELS